MRNHLFLLSILFLIIGCQKTTIQCDSVISNTNVINVETGEILYNMDVAIQGDTILSILSHDEVSHIAALTIDGTSKYLSPGLWDMHAHAWWAYEKFAPLLLANGVIGIREMSGNLPTINQLKKKLNKGEILGPMIVSSGPIVDGDPPTFSSAAVASTPEMGKLIVREQKENGADFIKVYFSLENKVYHAIANECEKLNIPLSGHIPSKVPLSEALKANHEGIEHYWGVLDNCADRKALAKMDNARQTRYDLKYAVDRLELVNATFDSSKVEPTLELISQNKAWICPTFVSHLGAWRNQDIEYPIDEHIKYLPHYVYEGWQIFKDSVLSAEAKRTITIDSTFLHRVTKITKPLLDRGVNFLAGTDFPGSYTYPGFSIHEELKFFVEMAGFTPLEALQTATINPAKFFNKEKEFGSIDIGKLASLVLFDQNPLESIDHTQLISGVFITGKFLEGKLLNTNLEAIKSKYELPEIRDTLYTIVQENGVEEAMKQYRSLKINQVDSFNFDEEQLEFLGYRLLDEHLSKEAVKLLSYNVELFPNNLYAWEALGEGYLAVGDKENAQAAYLRASELGSKFSEKELKKIGENQNVSGE